jgi:glycosyltransferase involved in cell wall biosynthesis
MKDSKVPTFSIITVCRNDLLNLKKTVASVQEQEYADYEYLICDGASTDGSVDYLATLTGVHIWSERDNGIFDAMNRGLARCKGTYVHFLNAGDLFASPHVLSTAAVALSTHPETDLLYGDVYCPNSERPYSLQPSRPTPFTLFRGTVCHQAWFLRTDAYRAVGGFDLTLRYKGDYDVLCHLLLKRHICARHESFCVAVYLGGGYSELNSEKSKTEFIKVQRRYMSPLRVWWYGVLFATLLPIKRNTLFQRLKASLNARRAARVWVSTKEGEIVL